MPCFLRLLCTLSHSLALRDGLQNHPPSKEKMLQNGSKFPCPKSCDRSPYVDPRPLSHGRCEALSLANPPFPHHAATLQMNRYSGGATFIIPAFGGLEGGEAGGRRAARPVYLARRPLAARTRPAGRPCTSPRGLALLPQDPFGRHEPGRFRSCLFPGRRASMRRGGGRSHGRRRRLPRNPLGIPS